MRSPSLQSAAALALSLLAGAGLAGCSAFDRASTGIAGILTPYRVEVVQGNFVSKEQVDALRPGMSREQVRNILGTPLLTDMFHADRWDYVFTIRREGVAPQTRKLTVFFKNGVLDHFEGDTMPTEAEFVASISSKQAPPKVPKLQASEQQLDKYAPPPAAADAPPRSDAPLPASYPPLDTPAN
ncbi:MAG: Outer membrane beta-barrel assembly protein BamE [Burkholderiaceae bacterium]|nr:MAG: Outer membrane beta-barrel assembly protein BamE [Burkholderiaceae bacterium]